MVKSPWIDEDLKNCMVERDEAKGMANKSGCTADQQKYGNLKNHVTKLNKKKNKLHYETKINEIKNISKKLWSALNEILGKKSQTQLHHSLKQMAHSSQNQLNHFNDFLIGKIRKLRHNMPEKDADTTHPSISDQIMKDKHCHFKFRKVSVEEVKQ